MYFHFSSKGDQCRKCIVLLIILKSMVCAISIQDCVTSFGNGITVYQLISKVGSYSWFFRSRNVTCVAKASCISFPLRSNEN